MSLRALTLSAIAAFSGCASTQYEQQQPMECSGHEHIDDAVAEAYSHFKNEDFTGATEVLLERRAQSMTTLSAPEQYLLTLSYCTSFSTLEKGAMEFSRLCYRFENDPTIINNIQDRLSEIHQGNGARQGCESLFEEPAYRELEDSLSNYAFFFPEVHGLKFFTALARKDFEGSAHHLEQVLPRMSDAAPMYARFLSRLVHDAEIRKDTERLEGYRLVHKVVTEFIEKHPLDVQLHPSSKSQKISGQVYTQR